MDDLVRVEIEVTPAAAEALKDEKRRRRVGTIVSKLVRPAEAGEDSLMRLFTETQQAARNASLTEADIDAELAAYNAERRR